MPDDLKGAVERLKTVTDYLATGPDFSDIRTLLAHLSRIQEENEARIGPRPHVLVCKGCPAYRTKEWMEPSGDGETYDSGQYAWCSAAGNRSMGSYHYDHSAAPSWCPALASQEQGGPGHG